MRWVNPQERGLYIKSNDEKKGSGNVVEAPVQDGVSMEDAQRISGTDIAGNPVKAIQTLVDWFYNIDVSPHGLKDFETFEETFIAIMILKFHMMVAKQKDYGPQNISKAGVRGVLTRGQDKLERAKVLIGDPESQVEKVKKLLSELPDDATVSELVEFTADVQDVVAPSNAVKGETIEDTFMDWGNYGDIAYALLMNAWGKPLRD